MSILESLLGLGANSDLTESTWWTDTVFAGLERVVADDPDADTWVADNSSPLPPPN